MSERELGVYLGHIVMAMDAIAEYIVGMRERISLTTARPKMPLSAIAKLSGSSGISVGRFRPPES